MSSAAILLGSATSDLGLHCLPMSPYLPLDINGYIFNSTSPSSESEFV